jgi:1-phosphofructokinase
MSDLAQKEASQTAKVITVTLAPSLERTMVTHFLGTGYKNRVTERVKVAPAGRGINIARALYRMMCNTTAVVLLGGDATASAYTALISQEGFDTIVLHTDSITSSEVVIYDSGHHTETRIVEDSAEATADDIAAVSDLLQNMLNPDDYVVFAGGLPQGVNTDTFGLLTDRLRSKGAKVVLVTEGKALEDALRARPELIVLTNGQLEAFFNYPIRTFGDIASSAHKLQERGALRVLVVNDERAIAVLVDEEAGWLAELNEEDDGGTTSGVWDAFVAGYLTGRIKRNPLDQSLELGAAAASYAISHVGTDFGDEEEIASHQSNIEVMQIDENNENTTTTPVTPPQ